MKVKFEPDSEAWDYLESWLRGFPVLLRWSPDQVYTWAKKFENLMAAPNKQFYNCSPTQLMITTLLPQELKKTLSNDERLWLESRLLSALDQEGTLASIRMDFDWQAARQRVRGVLKEYGSDLPE